MVLIRVGVAELAGFAGRAEAVAAIDRAAAAARQQDLELLCLPALSTAPFFPRAAARSRDWYDLGERGRSASVAAFRATAISTGVWIAGSYYEVVSEGVFHIRSVLVDPGGELVASQRQIHVDRRPGSWELFYLQPGREGIAAVPTPFGAVALLSGADAQFPEAWRLAALAGAELVLLGLSEPAGELEPVLRQVAGAAAANAFVVVAANRRGTELGVEFAGGSSCLLGDGSGIDPRPAGGLLAWDVDLDAAREQRARRRPLRGRRTDRYGALLEL